MSAYLAALDELLASGLAHAPRSLLARQARFVIHQQQRDGGFRGRDSGSDLYYSDFALRVLALCALDSDAFDCVPSYLTLLPPPRYYLDAFSLLNCARLLKLHKPRLNLDL